jgi:hypothetical protein
VLSEASEADEDARTLRDWLARFIALSPFEKVADLIALRRAQWPPTGTAPA